MTPKRHSQLGLVLAVTGLVGCDRAKPNEFWQAGASYELRIAVNERPAHLPSVPAPATNSLRVVVSIESASADSLFGRYSDGLDSLGVMVGDGSIGPQLVAIHAQADSFTLVLAPNVMDAQVVMTGTVRDDIGTGAWRQLAPAAPAGSFEVRRVPR